MPDRFDTAIVDLGLPDRRGDMLVGELRATRPGLPVVIASGSNTQMLERSLREDSGVATIEKPYTAEQLVGALARLGVAVELKGK
jgi:CheY-like chemotaxis protein